MTGRERSDVVLLAPLCRDEIVTPSGATSRTGGAGLYASWALTRLGCGVRLHTPLAETDTDLLEALPKDARVTVHPSRATTRFQLTIDPERPDERTLRNTEQSDPLDHYRIVDLDSAAYVLFCPLLPHDLDLGLLGLMCSCPCPIDVGIQGLVRSIDSNGIANVRAVPLMGLPPIRVLAGDETEITTIAKTDDPDLAIDSILAKGVEEVVMTRASRGARIGIDAADEILELPALPPRRAAAESIGLGDTFLAVYGWHRHIGNSPADAGKSAATAATRLMEEGLRGV